MSKYKAYPSYKDSGVEWLGEIPEHWGQTRLKFLGYSFGGLSGKAGKDFNQADDPRSKAFIPFTNIANSPYIKDDYFGLVIIEENEHQNRAKKGDLFFLMSSEGFEDLGKSSLLDFEVNELYLNSFCKGFRILKKDVLPKYVNYLLQGDTYRKLLYTQGNGFTRINLRLEKLNDLRLAIAPLQEQQTIANYLDTATAKIDTLIAKQTKLIELLAEKRQAVISTAVTRGLDSTVAMKESGVAWLGEIPEGWEVKKLAYLASKIGSGKTPRGGAEVYSDEGVIFLRSQNVYDEGLFLDDVVRISENINQDMANTQVQSGDILLNVTGGSIGRTTIVSSDFERANVNQHVCIIRLISSKFRNYISLVMKSKTIKTQIDAIQNGAAREGLNFEQIAGFKIAMPPLKEQQDISRYIESKTQTIDTLITKATQAIALLKERRTALISAVVTGKVDVREQAREEML